jgi:hypothetical protein
MTKTTTPAAEAAPTPHREQALEAALLPCPFCGGAADFGSCEDGGNAGGEFIECGSCHASSTLIFNLKGDDIHAILRGRWNARASRGALNRPLAKLSAAIVDSHDNGMAFVRLTPSDAIEIEDALEAALALPPEPEDAALLDVVRALIPWAEVASEYIDDEDDVALLTDALKDAREAVANSGGPRS